MNIKVVETKKIIVPKRMVYRRELYRIVDIDPKFVIRNYTIRLFDNKIESVFLDAPHPNSDPTTGEFCIPNELRELTLNSETREFIEHLFNVFNIDNCYFTPWGDINYEKV